VLWALRVGAGRATFGTPRKPVGHAESIGALLASGWCTVVVALNAESIGPNEFPYNGWSLHLSSCSCRRRPWPRVCQVGNGSRWQAVAWTSEAHPSTYPTTPSSRDHLPLALPSPSPLVASCCRAEPACSHAWLGCDRPADLGPEATQLKLASLGQPGWVDDRERKPRVCRHLVASREPRTARKRNRGRGGVLVRTNMGGDRLNFGL